MENFFPFFKKIIFFFKNCSTDFQKRGANENSTHFPVCLLNSLVSFTYLTFYSFRIFDPYFCLFFLHYLLNYPPKSEILISIKRTGSGGKISCASVYAQVFYTKIMALKKSQIFDFLTIFGNFFSFLENYSPKSEILVSMGRTCCGKLLCLSGSPTFSYTKIMTLGKAKFSIFLS